MNIKEFKLGMMPTNAFLVWKDKEAILFDCGGANLSELENFIEENKILLKKVIFTHGHYDHIAGLIKLKEIYPNVEVYIGEEEKNFFIDSALSLSDYLAKVDFKYEDNYKTLKNGETIDEFLVIDTPGHTQGGKCFFHKESGILIAGDTMFKGSYGRYDLPTSDGKSLFASLKKLCDTLPADTKVYNGHSGMTTIGEEKDNLTRNGII
ncbi:MAG: MBL fold metallo-hydrolase [Psychrilyobacter sp.]|uniref:MBL fold metallo-hydrolase n=1 Tax=Psychrilyobacter sp. TaxID=2586924 RepID=UPI003C76536F